MSSDSSAQDRAQSEGGPAGDDDSSADAGLDHLRAQLKESEAQHLRLAADFANFRRRASQEQLETTRQAAGALARRLLPVLDNLGRALEHAPANIDENWLRGIRLTAERLRDELASVGVAAIEALGTRFDPRLHEAVGSEESTEHPEGTVVQELRPGYTMNREVLRPSLVKIARRPAESDTRDQKSQTRGPSEGGA